MDGVHTALRGTMSPRTSVVLRRKPKLEPEQKCLKDQRRNCRNCSQPERFGSASFLPQRSRPPPNIKGTHI